METRIGLTVKLPIRIIRKKTCYVAACPALDVVTQGETEEQAKKNIADALYLFLRSCIERGTLDAVLKQCGFTAVVEEEQEETGKSRRSQKEDYVDIPIYLLSQFNEGQHCRPA